MSLKLPVIGSGLVANPLPPHFPPALFLLQTFPSRAEVS